MGISSKITLYDFLCMLVCGYLILCILTGNDELLHSDNLLLYVLSYVVGMVYHKGLYWLFSKFHVQGNWKCMVMRSRDKVEKNVGSELLQSKDMKGYYEDYYYLMQNKCLGNIPVLEAQAAFCKDLFFLLLIIIIWNVCGYCNINLFDNACLLRVLLIIICTAQPIVWYFTQMKIHELVWEGAYYLKKIEKE